jgi:hypothetical protein
MPKVSVIIPAYNCAKYICEAIDSVLDQTFRDFEIIIVDSSSDNTLEILKKYGSKIRYFFQRNAGVSAARNLGIKVAQGEYIAFLDADDVWLQDKLQLEIDILSKNHESAIIFTDCESFNFKGTVRHSLTRITTKPERDSLGFQILQTTMNDGSIFKGYFYKDLLWNNFIPTCTVLAKKKVFDEVRYFNENLLVCEDYDLWLRIALAYPLIYLNKVTARYRLRDDGLSGKEIIRPYLYKKWHGEIMEIHLKNCPMEYKNFITAKVIDCYKNAIWGYFNNNDCKEARSLCIKSLSFNKQQKKLFLYLLFSFMPISVIKIFRKANSLLCQKSA